MKSNKEKTIDPQNLKNLNDEVYSDDPVNKNTADETNNKVKHSTDGTSGRATSNTSDLSEIRNNDDDIYSGSEDDDSEGFDNDYDKLANCFKKKLYVDQSGGIHDLDSTVLIIDSLPHKHKKNEALPEASPRLSNTSNPGMFGSSNTSKTVTFNKRNPSVEDQIVKFSSLYHLVRETGASNYYEGSTSGSYCHMPFNSETNPVKDDYVAYGTPLVNALKAIQADIDKRVGDGTIKHYQHLDQAVKAIRLCLTPSATSRFIADSSMKMIKGVTNHVCLTPSATSRFIADSSMKMIKGVPNHFSPERMIEFNYRKPPFKAQLAMDLLSKIKSDARDDVQGWPEYDRDQDDQSQFIAQALELFDEWAEQHFAVGNGRTATDYEAPSIFSSLNPFG